MKRNSYRIFAYSVILSLILTALPAPQPVLAVSPDIVISQVYGGGGNTSATYTHDFIELFNRGTSPVSLAGWSVQYASATGTGNFGSSATQLTELPGVTLAPGQYLLIQEAQGAGGTTPLPTSDVIDSSPIPMSGSGGKVALVMSTTGLGCNGGSTPCDATQLALIKDLVGWDGANFYESAAAPATTNVTASLRLADGCTETDNNSLDFVTISPTPRNTSSAFHYCSGPSNPTGLGLAVPSNVELAGSSLLTVAVIPGDSPTSTGITVSCDLTSIGGSASQSLFDDGLNGDVASGDNTFSYLATVDNGSIPGTKSLFCTISDEQARISTPTIALIVIEYCGDPFTPINTVQGSGLASPLVSTEVAVEGIVVGDFQNNATPDNGNLNGFHIQDPVGDGDPATSDGIFIYAAGGMNVAVGDAVRVRGSVSEFNGLTEITASQIWGCTIGNPLPTASVLSLPVTSVDHFEAYEGMFVTFPQPLVISEYFNFDRFNEIVLTSERHLTPSAEFEPGADAVQAAQAFLLDKITLDDGRSSQNPNPAIHPNGTVFDLGNLFRGGDTVANVTGVMDYSFGLYRIQPTQGADYTSVNPRTAAPDEVGGNLKVVSMNTLNFFSTIDQGKVFWICGPAQNQECRGADSPEELTRQRAKLVAAITTMDADVIGLLEIENNFNDEAVQNLVDALNSEIGAGTYDSIHTGPIGGDAIKVALIYKPATVSLVGGYAILNSSVDSRFIDTKNRPTLAQSFMDKSTGGIFTVAVNHLKSKGSDCNDVGDPDLGDGAGNCNLTRKAAAEALVDWLATDPTGSGDADFLIIGDLNSYDKEDPIDAIKAGPDDILGTGDDYTDLADNFQGEDAYSYVFDGQVGYLDYGLANASLMEEVTGMTDWHVNADEPDLIDYDMSFKQSAQDALYAPDAYRNSDHDPVIIGLSVCDEIAPEFESVSVTPDVLWPADHQYFDITATVVVSDNLDPNPTVSLVSVTSNEPDNGEDDGNTINDIVIVNDFSFKLRAERSGIGTGRIYTITYMVTDVCGNSTIQSVTIFVPLSMKKR